MTTRSDPGFDQRLADWLEEDPVHAPPETSSVVLAAFPSIPQRRSWRRSWRFLTMRPFTIASVATASIVLASLGGAVIRPPSSTTGGPDLVAPSPTPLLPEDYDSVPGWIVFEHFGKAPDGSSTEMDYNNRMIWLVKADGSGLHELAPGQPADGKASPDISPDGTLVAFMSWDPAVVLYEAPIEGGEPRLLSSGCSGLVEECQEYDPAYSPDGSRLAFVHLGVDGDTTYTELAIRDRATGEVTYLESTRRPADETWLSQPTWSPDGTRIAYHIATDQGDSYPSPLRIWIVGADGSDPEELATPAGEDAADADWSPDGSRIVYSTVGFRESEGRQVDPKISSINPDGTDVQLLCDGDTGGCMAPSWTPDGRHILYWGFQTWNLMGADGSNQAPVNAPALTLFGDQLGFGYSAVWQPTP